MMIERRSADSGKGQYVGDLKEGDPVHGHFAIRSKEPPREYRNKAGRYFFMEVGDRTGDIGVKYWGGRDAVRTQRIYEDVRPGDVVLITGVVQEDRFEKRPVITVNEGKNFVRPSDDDIRNEDYLPVSTRDLDELMGIVLSLVSSVRQPHLRALLEAFFGDEGFCREFRNLPSAKVHHHNYIGGNLEHVVGVVEVCEALCRVHPGLDRDLLVTGALLHDVGKMRTYIYGTYIDLTDEGRFLGHAHLGERMVRRRMEGMEGFPPELANRLSHMILKHMGSYEDHEIRGMRTMEALALHLADNCDAQIKEFDQELRKGRDLASGNWYHSRTFRGPIYLGEGGAPVGEDPDRT